MLLANDSHYPHPKLKKDLQLEKFDVLLIADYGLCDRRLLVLLIADCC